MSSFDSSGKIKTCGAALFRRGDANAHCGLDAGHPGDHVFRLDAGTTFGEQDVSRVRLEALEDAVGVLDKAGLREASILVAGLIRKGVH